MLKGIRNGIVSGPRRRPAFLSAADHNLRWTIALPSPVLFIVPREATQFRRLCRGIPPRQAESGDCDVRPDTRTNPKAAGVARDQLC
jgi:hypothetical protein